MCRGKGIVLWPLTLVLHWDIFGHLQYNFFDHFGKQMVCNLAKL